MTKIFLISLALIGSSLFSSDTSFCKSKNNEMVFVSGGKFLMNGRYPKEEKELLTGKIATLYGRNRQKADTVQVNSFFIDKYETTYAEYKRYRKNAVKPTTHRLTLNSSNYPSSHVSWYDAIEYCNWKSKKDNLEPCYTINKKVNSSDTSNHKDFWEVSCNWNANGYRLPTVAEWEYAAGGGDFYSEGWAGTEERNKISLYANTNVFLKRENPTVTKVGSYLPNKLGLYDMTGNVSEWCWDLRQNIRNESRVMRLKGGACISEELAGIQIMNEGTLGNSTEYWTAFYIGFRCVRNAQD